MTDSFNATTDIYFYSASDGSITNTSVSSASNLSAFPGGIGILLYNGTNYTSLTNDTAYYDVNGFYLLSSGYDNLTNDFAYNSTQGVNLSASSYDTLTNDTLYNCSSTPILLTGSSYNNLTNNTVYGTSAVSEIGLYTNSNNNTLINNTARNGVDGIILYSSSNNTLINNTANNNTQYGFLLWTSANYNSLSGNIAYNNSLYGFYLLTTSSKTFREHISTLREVFKVYRDNKIYLKPSKVVLAAAEISFLGWIIGDGMVRPDPSKVKAVSEWPRPASAHDVQSFLGLVNWFHKMLPGFAALAAPLYELTKKKAAWHWENVHESAFLELKRLLCSAPGLRIADPAKAYIVAADASGEAIGAVLLQEHQEVLHPVAFLSRKLSALEHRLPTHDREMLAVITALQRWRPYLYGAVNTTVWTDHNPLTHFATQPKLSMKQVRWLDVFAEFQARMVYRKGAAMSGPDALSRAVHGEDPRRSEQHDVFQAHIASAEQMFALRASMVGAAEGWEQALASAVKGDQFFGPIVNKLSLASAGASKGWPGVRYELIEGLLYLRAKPGATRRLCLPAKGSFRLEMLREAHDSAMAAHRGETATIERMQRDFFFKGMAKFTRQFVSSCGACQRSKAEHSRKRGLLVPLAVTSVPYSELAMDFVGGFPAVAGLDQVLVVVDRCTRAGSFIPCKSNASAVEVARLFFENIVRRFGMPRVVVSDRDTKFTGKFWTELFRLAGSRLDMSTADHPQSDGLTERLNRTLVEMLRALVGHDQGDWVEKLAAVEFAYNSTAHSATGSPPFKLLYGFMPAAPAGIWSNNGGEPDSRVEATARFVRTQKAAWVVASDAVLAGQSKMAAIADKARVDAHFKVGDLVLIDADALMTPVERARPRLKLRALAVGPLAVTALVGPNAVRVKLPAGSRAHDVVNISKLRPFTANSMPGREVEKPPQVIGTDGDLEDVVRDIVAHKGSGQSRLFLTRWEGEEDCDATWQSAGSFIDSDGGVTKQFADYCVRHSFPLPTAV